MEALIASELRNKKSFHQKIKPRKTICKKCPHAYEVKTKSCSLADGEIFGLEEPHICHSERDGLCRGVTEKMIMNNIKWQTLD